MDMEPSERASPPAVAQPAGISRAVFAGLSANLVGIALARFAYTPLVPTLIERGWFAPGDVAFLGAANLAGYLVGALLGRPMAGRFGNAAMLRAMMALVTASFFACAAPLSFVWYFGWRLASGIAGGVIMVLVAATVLPHVPEPRRAFASGIVFLGLGLGIAGTGTLIPALLQQGLVAVWAGLGLLSLVLTAATWHGWPRDAAAAPPSAPTAHVVGDAPPADGVRRFYLMFALTAVGLVPPMVFLADYIARGLGWGSQAASLYWSLYGVGAICGPIAYAQLGQRLGASLALRLVLGLEALALLGLTLSSGPVALALCSVLLGSFPPGVVPLCLARIRGLRPGNAEAQQASWSRATMAFALTQAGIAYACSYVFKQTHGNHVLLFLIGAGGFVASLLVDLWPRRR